GGAWFRRPQSRDLGRGRRRWRWRRRGWCWGRSRRHRRCQRWRRWWRGRRRLRCWGRWRHRHNRLGTASLRHVQQLLELRQLGRRLRPLTRQAADLDVRGLTQLDPLFLRVLADRGPQLGLGAFVTLIVFRGLERRQLRAERIDRLLQLRRASAELIEHTLKSRRIVG